MYQPADRRDKTENVVIATTTTTLSSHLNHHTFVTVLRSSPLSLPPGTHHRPLSLSQRTRQSEIRLSFYWDSYLFTGMWDCFRIIIFCDSIRILRCFFLSHSRVIHFKMYKPKNEVLMARWFANNLKWITLKALFSKEFNPYIWMWLRAE